MCQDMMFLASNSLHDLRGQKWLCPCYHRRHLQQIHWNKKDVWFGCDAGYDNTQCSPNDSNSSIDFQFLGAVFFNFWVQTIWSLRTHECSYFSSMIIYPKQLCTMPNAPSIVSVVFPFPAHELLYIWRVKDAFWIGLLQDWEPFLPNN